MIRLLRAAWRLVHSFIPGCGRTDSLEGHVAYFGFRCGDITRESQRTVIMVTHDRELAAKTDRFITLRDGRIESDTAVGMAPRVGRAGPRDSEARS